MTSLDKPKLYFIQHPLADKTLPEETLATFTDADVNEYESEYQIYKDTQQLAVEKTHEYCQELKKYLGAVFGGTDTKVVKYIERAIRGGDALTDIHAKNYLHPSDVRGKVLRSRERYSAFTDTTNAPKTTGDDTLQEINNAVAFLMEEGLVLNTDFTISNAVSLAKAKASESLDSHLQERDSDGESCWKDASQFNIFLNDGSRVDTKKYAFSYINSNINTKCLSLDMGDGTEEDEESNEEMRNLNSDGGYYKVSFRDSSTPSYTIVCDN